MSAEGSLLDKAGARDRRAGAYRLAGQIGFILRKAHQRHVSIFAANIPDLTPPQFAALAMLDETGPTSQNQLGQSIAMDAATVKGVVDRLRSRGFVEVDRDADDRRRLTVRLTAKGTAEIRNLIPLAERVTRETLKPLDGAEVERLVALLSRIA